MLIYISWLRQLFWNARKLKTLRCSGFIFPSNYTYPAHTQTSAWWGKFHNTDLNRMIDVALADSPTMQEAASRVRAANHLVDETQANLWPSIDASGYLERARFPNYGLVPPPFNGRTFNIGDVGLTLNYDFDLWGKNREQVAAQVNELCAAQADVAQARLILTTAIMSTYIQLQNAIQERQFAEEILAQQNELLKIIQVRSKRGLVSESPVKVNVVSVETARLAAMRYQQIEGITRHQLALLMGKNALNTTLKFVPLHVPDASLHLPQVMPARLLAARPDIIAARLRTEAAAHRVKVAKARFFPDINLNVLFSYQTIEFNRFFEPGSQSNSIQGIVDLPIFDAGARRANLGVQYAQYDVAVNQYNQNILTALKEVADQETILQTVSKQLRTHQQAVIAARQNYKLSRARYRHGITDYAELINAKLALLQYESVQADLEASYLDGIVGLARALGGNELVIRGKV